MMTKVAVRRLFAVLLVWPWAAPLWAGAPQTGLEVDTLTIATSLGAEQVFEVELATTPAQMAHGLMFVTEMALDHGMLFIYPDERPVSFWMKNTYIPLDMIFIRGDGVIANIARNTTPQSLEGVPSDGPVRAVLEVNAGVAALIGLQAGDRVAHAAFEP